MTAHRSARQALDAALAAHHPTAQDAAAVQLARNYARLLDNAAPAGKYAKAFDWLTRLRVDDKAEQFRLIILIALSEHSVASDLGPKHLAALDALGITPAARARLSARGVAPVDPPPESAYQQALRERDELALKRAEKR